MQQNSFAASTKHFTKLIKFLLFEQNVSLGHQKKFCCAKLFLTIQKKNILFIERNFVGLTKYLLMQPKFLIESNKYSKFIKNG